MTPKQIATELRKARGKRRITEVARESGLQVHQVKAIEEATRPGVTLLSVVNLAKAVNKRVVVVDEG